MPYYLVHAGIALQKIASDGTVSDITLPQGVTVDSTRPARFALLNKTLLVGNAPSRTLLFDGGLTAHLAGLTAPSTAPSVGAGSGTLIGDYYCAYSFAIKDGKGNVIVESDLSPVSAVQTLATQGLAISALALSVDAQVTTRRIYRSASGSEEGQLYWTYDIDDNITQTYTSTELDAALGTEDVANVGLGPVPGTSDADRLKLFTVWKDRIWGISDTNPDDLRFSGSRMPYAWDVDNYISIPPVGEDLVGVNGFLARRNELGVLKLGKLCKIIGSSPDDFEMVVVQEGVGSIAPDSCIVIRDVGYFLSHDGVYCWGPEGVYSISDAQVRPWFTTTLFFNRPSFAQAFGRYNWRTHSYELHLPSAGQTNNDVWVQYDIERKRWFGPHKTLAFAPTSGGQITDDDGLPIPAVGSAAGQLWTQDNDEVMDGDYEIALGVLTQPYTENAADYHKLFHEMSLINKNQGSGFIRVGPAVDADVQRTFLVPQDRSRTRCRRIGNGRLLTVEFVHDTMYEDCEIHGFEVPFTVTGRR
jgi:hypothetical protein